MADQPKTTRAVGYGGQLGLWVALGSAIGTALGIAGGDVAVGTALGVGGGALLGGWLTWHTNRS